MLRAAAIFDLDGTLLGGTSAERLFISGALRSGAISPGRFAGGLLWALVVRIRGRTHSVFESKAYLQGAECRRLEALGVHCVHTEVRPRLRPALLEAIEAHRAQGRAIVLLTGTLDFLAAEVARIVRAEHLIPARLERRAGRFTGWALAPYPHGEGKVRELRALASAAGLDLAASHAYANRRSDAAHLRLVGFPHAVAPDRGLRRVALANGWSIHEEPDDGRAARTRSDG